MTALEELSLLEITPALELEISDMVARVKKELEFFGTYKSYTGFELSLLNAQSDDIKRVCTQLLRNQYQHLLLQNFNSADSIAIMSAIPLILSNSIAAKLSGCQPANSPTSHIHYTISELQADLSIIHRVTETAVPTSVHLLTNSHITGSITTNEIVDLIAPKYDNYIISAILNEGIRSSLVTPDVNALKVAVADAREYIARSTKRDYANKLVLSQAMYDQYKTEIDLWNINVIIYNWTPAQLGTNSDLMLVAYKGPVEVEAGLMVAPYIVALADGTQTAGECTFNTEFAEFKAPNISAYYQVIEIK